MKASNLPPEGFKLDSELLPEGFTLDSIHHISDDTNVFVLDDLSDLNVFVLDNNGEKEVYVLDEQEALVPIEEYPKSIIVQGPKGPRGEQGIPGLKGSTGDQGEQGDSGEDAPALEWEFCEIDKILDGGIRLRNPDGSWSECKRIVGRDGKDGAGGGASDGATGGGGGPPPPTPIPVTASNIGPGEGWFAGKVVNELQFKTLIAGSGITASSTASTIEITASSAGHIIVDPAGSSLAQRSRLQFIGTSGIVVNVSNIDASTTLVTISASDLAASAANLDHLVHRRNQLGHILMQFDPTARVSKYFPGDPLVVVDRGGCIVNAKFAASCVPPFVLP